ncbi:Serine dehydratase alpha chain [Caballeronia arvi]|uniref:Serine dehydratase alpha chain n=2 Tax=Caballeronia arvi TaxID=1777135 RepID=A0A158KJF7_9BURK|nr:Serine dehydratase alpha chain [Caballeronia arvi]
MSDPWMVIALTGAVFAVWGSYAAKTSGCSVETSISAAMAGAYLTYFLGGNRKQIVGGASICRMNTLGLM